MGYDITIRRNIGNRISLEEFKDFLVQNPDFSSNSIYDKTESKFQITSPLWDCVFCEIDGKEVPFAFYEGRGEITVKSPDQTIVNKMIEMADFFQAIVIGEEEEVYSADFPMGKFPDEEEEELVEKTESAPKLRWWKKIFQKTGCEDAPWKQIVGASFHYQKNDKSYQNLVEFLKRLDTSNLITIEKSCYHVEDTV